MLYTSRSDFIKVSLGNITLKRETQKLVFIAVFIENPFTSHFTQAHHHQ